MPIKNLFQTAGEPAIATYDFFDLAESVGVKRFYACGIATDAGTTFKLITNPHHSINSNLSTENHERSTIGNSGVEKASDISFYTLPFNKPKVISGTMIAVIPFTAIAAGATGWSAYCTLSVYSVRGVSETLLVTDSSRTNIEGGDEPSNWNVPLVIPKTVLARGDQIKIQVEVYATKVAGTGDTAIGVAYDIENAVITAINASGTSEERLNFAAGDSRMTFDIPFLITL